MEYEIIKRIGVIEGKPEQIRKELNIISWDNKTPKLDIRTWVYDKPGKGICLDEAALQKLKMLIGDVTL